MARRSWPPLRSATRWCAAALLSQPAASAIRPFPALDALDATGSPTAPLSGPPNGHNCAAQLAHTCPPCSTTWSPRFCWRACWAAWTPLPARPWAPATMRCWVRRQAAHRQAAHMLPPLHPCPPLVEPGAVLWLGTPHRAHCRPSTLLSPSPGVHARRQHVPTGRTLPLLAHRPAGPGPRLPALPANPPGPGAPAAASREGLRLSLAAGDKSPA